MKILLYLVVLFLLSMIIPFNTYALNVTIEWDANAETVEGYKLYYQGETTGPPFNGTGATEGDSPIDVKNITTFSITNLPNGVVYYFSVTAYKGSLESGYSNIVSTDKKIISPLTPVTGLICNPE